VGGVGAVEGVQEEQLQCSKVTQEVERSKPARGTAQARELKGVGWWCHTDARAPRSSHSHRYGLCSSARSIVPWPLAGTCSVPLLLRCQTGQGRTADSRLRSTAARFTQPRGRGVAYFALWWASQRPIRISARLSEPRPSLRTVAAQS
jgi:hypothetical protein